MWRLLIFTLLVGLSIETRPATVRKLCRPGDTIAVTFPDNSFRCKPGPAKYPYCQKFHRNTALPFVCPNNGYYSGWVTTPPFALDTCCFEPGLIRKDCISVETVWGQPAPVKPDRVIVGAYSKNLGRSWIRLQCRYLGYPRATNNVKY